MPVLTAPPAKRFKNRRNMTENNSAMAKILSPVPVDVLNQSLICSTALSANAKALTQAISLRRSITMPCTYKSNELFFHGSWKDWRHTPYAFLITLYANHFICSAPRTLLHRPYGYPRSKHPRISVEGFMAREKVRTSGKNRRIYLVQGTCTVTECSRLLVRRDASLCTSVVPKPFHRPHPSITQAQRTRSIRGPGWCSSHNYERLLELSWESRDYAVVSALFAHMREEGIPPTSRTAYEGVIRSEFALFGKVSRSKSSKETITARTLGGRAT